MATDISIVEVAKDGPDGIIVTFSDRTSDGYTVEDLLELRPHRMPVEEPAKMD